MFFVMKIVPTSRGHIESNLRMGGYKHQDTAFAAAKRERTVLSTRPHTSNRRSNHQQRYTGIYPMTPHKHAALIKAWADGVTIEAKFGGKWVTVYSPCWDTQTQYRVKPEPKSDKLLLWEAMGGSLIGLEGCSPLVHDHYERAAAKFLQLKKEQESA